MSGTEMYVNSVRLKLSDYISNTKRSQSAVSKGIGISAAALSQFLSRSYMGSNEDVAIKAEQFMNRESERKNYTPKPGFTSKLKNTLKINSALDYTFNRNSICIVIGDAGCGKTTALQNYTELNNGAVYVQADATKSSPRAILNLIVKTFGFKIRGTTSEILDKIIEELTGTNCLLIIDEAQHLTERSFDTIRAINDKAEIGIVYAGTPNIFNRMFGKRADELDQVYSRHGFLCELKNRYSIDDISNIFRDFKLSKTILKHLLNVSSRKGGLRLAVNLFRLANDIAVRTGEEFNEKHLEIASMNVGNGGAL